MKTYDFCAANFPTIPTIPTTLKRPAEEQLSSQIKRRPDWIKKVSANAWANEVKNIRKLPVEERAIRPIYHEASDEYIRCVADSVTELFAWHAYDDPKPPVCATALMNLFRALSEDRVNFESYEYINEVVCKLTDNYALRNLCLKDCDFSNLTLSTYYLNGANFAGVDLSKNTVFNRVEISEAEFDEETIFNANQKFTLKLWGFDDPESLTAVMDYTRESKWGLFSIIENINDSYLPMKVDLIRQVNAEASKYDLISVSQSSNRFFLDHVKYLADDAIFEFFLARSIDLQKLGKEQLEQMNESCATDLSKHLTQRAPEPTSSQIERRKLSEAIAKIDASTCEIDDLKKLPVAGRAIRSIDHKASDEFIFCIADSVVEIFEKAKNYSRKPTVCALALINLIRASNDEKLSLAARNYISNIVDDLTDQDALKNLILQHHDLSNLNLSGRDLNFANFAGVDLSQNTVMENVDISNSIFNNDTIFSPNQKFTLKLDDIASDDSHLIVYFEYPKTVNTCLFSTIEKINDRYWPMKLKLMHQVIAEASKRDLVSVSVFINRFFVDHPKYFADDTIFEFVSARSNELQKLGKQQFEQLSDHQ